MFGSLLIGSTLALAVATAFQLATLRHVWDQSASVVFGVAWLLNLTHVAAALTGSYAWQRDSMTGKWHISYGDLPESVHRAGLVILALAGVLLLFKGLAAGRPLNPAGLVAALLTGVVLLSTWWNRDPIDWSASSGMLLIAGLAIILPRGAGARLGAAIFGVSVILVSTFLLVTAQGASTLPCDNKCGPLAILYTGAYPNENALGLTVALSLPYIVATFEGRARSAATIAVVMTVVATASRTAQFATAVTLSVFILAHLLQKRKLQLGRAFLAVATIGVTLLALAIPLLLGSAYSSMFTGRGRLWSVAKERWQDNWLIGWGGVEWSQVRQSTWLIDEATYSPHSQWLTILFSGGLIAAFLFGLLLIVIYRSTNDAFSVGLVIIAVMTIGVLETPWSVTSPDWLFWSLLAACLSGSPRVAMEGPSSLEPESAPRHNK